MALNFSCRAVFPNYSSEESSVSSIKFGKNTDCFGSSASSQGFYWELENSHDYRRGEGEKEGSCEVDSDDIIDSLPADPFGMNIRSTFTEISGWIEDMKDLESASYGFSMYEAEAERVVDHRLFAGLNLVRNGAMSLPFEMGNMKINENPILHDSCNESVMDNGSCDDGGFVSEGHLEEFIGFSDVGNWVVSDQAKRFQDCNKIYPDGKGEPPHDALIFALGYLGVRDLLSVERVCRSLRDEVKSDPLLWRSIHIDQPLSERITDDALLQLTSMAQGTLQCLSLVECLKITDSGLKRVLESNPGLIKLSVPGCVRLTVEGILFNLKAFKSVGTPGIKLLRISGLFGVTNKHFEELKFLLDAENYMQLKAHKPRFYCGRQLYLSCDDDRAIDIETCPRCEKLRPVFDCPAETCQGKHHTAQLCRACVLCIARCIQCGRCVKDGDYEETFSLDPLCLDCWNKLLDCQERLEESATPSSKHTIFHQETSYHFCLYG